MAYNEQLVAEITRRVISALQSAQQPETENHPVSAAESPKGFSIREIGEAPVGAYPDEEVIGHAPAFGAAQTKTICGLPHSQVLREIAAGIE